MRTKTNATALLGRVIAPMGRCLTPAAAKRFFRCAPILRPTAALRFWPPSATVARSRPKNAEYRLFVEVGDLVVLLHAEARRHLAERSGA